MKPLVSFFPMNRNHSGRRILRRSLPLVAGVFGSLSVGAFTFETPQELSLGADFDGDGRADIALVDRESGTFRIGYQTAPGTHEWADARSGGIPGVSGATSGRVLDLTQRQLLVTGPTANRVNILAVNSPSAVAPVGVFTAGIGPEGVVALDVPGAGNTAHDDLVVVSSRLSPPNRTGIESVRNNAGAFSGLSMGTLAAPLEQVQTVTLTTPGADLIAAIQVGANSDSFRVWNAGGSPNAPVASLEIPQDHRYVFGRFNNHERHHFLFFRRGLTTVRSAPVEPGPVLGASVEVDFGARVEQLIPLATSPNRLLLVRTGGSQALICRFDGSSKPVLEQDFTPPAGETFASVVPSADGSFHLFSGPAGEGISGNFRRYTFDGTKYALAGSGALPGLNPAGTAANVFLFAGEPFVAATPVMVRSLNAADWSSQPDVSGATVKVQAERLGSSSAGLGHAAVRDLGPKPAGVTHALPNQYARPISVASLRPAVGDEVVDFALTPPPGPQQGAMNVMITALNSPATIVWRTAPDQPWTSVANVAFVPLFRDTNLEFFGLSGNRKSRIRTARYTFPAAPAEQDSDGDGVPDFVELAKGLNPNGGSDSDADGYTDLDELLAGSNPKDLNSPPAAVPIGKAEVNAAFDLVATPRPWDGFTPGEVPALVDQSVHLHRLDGSLVESELTANLAIATLKPAARFADAPADTTLSLLSVATDSHLQIASAGPVKNVGREVLGFVPVPALAPPAVNFTPTAAPLETQVDAWIAAAKSAFAAAAQPLVQTRFGARETVAALLLERKVESLLTVRGFSFPPTNRLSLFSFRAGDVGRQAISLGDLATLESLGSNGEAAWKLSAVWDQLNGFLALPDAAKLLALAEDVYRVSSLSNNAAPGKYPLPVDSLRGFFDTGILHSNYLAASALTGPDLTTAFTTSKGMLNALTPRPTVTLDLEVTAASFQPHCTSLRIVGSAATRNLFIAPGSPFKFPESFQLLAGSHVRVLAFNDFTDPCPGEDLQVIRAELIAIPAPTFVDSDGDLLPDDWECAFLGGVGDNGSEDFDGDGIGNLQEYFDGTDPKDAKSAAAVAVNLNTPAVQIEDAGDGKLKLKWSFPAAYADKFDFTVHATSDLATGFAGEAVSPVHLGGGEFEVNLTAEASAKFFVLQSLKAAPGARAQSAEVRR